MNFRTVTIIVITCIPIIIVAWILIQSKLKASRIESCDKNEICVRICCQHKLSCDDRAQNVVLRKIEDHFNETFKIFNGRQCEKYELGRDEFKFLNNGFISVEEIEISWNEYCLDIRNDSLVAKVCFPEDETEIIQEIYPYFILASIPFLLITFFVYGCIKALRNLHGKCLMAYVFSLTIMYATLAAVKLYEIKLAADYPLACVILGYTFIAFVFCCFFWLNVLCYDIFRTFRNVTKSKMRFTKYCAYAFGIPFTIVSIMFILNNYELIPDEFNNGIGRNSCTVRVTYEEFQNSKILQLLYIYGPIVILLSVNMLFYGTTAWKIFRVQMETQKACKANGIKRHSKTSPNDNRARFFLYSRLAIVMGIPWIFEVFSWLHGSSIWLSITSIFNCMQGFVIFITYVWNPKITKHFRQRHPQGTEPVLLKSSTQDKTVDSN